MFQKPAQTLVANSLEYETRALVKATGFREYDARWLFGQELNLMGVQALGLGLGTLLHEMGVAPRLVTGHDFRSYSASIKHALTTGLVAAGVEVLYDDRGDSAGAKFANADLIGIPYQVTIGPRGLANGVVEIKTRATGEKIELAIDAALAKFSNR